MKNDWPNLKKYATENISLKLTSNFSKNVVYIGDSITEFWEVINPFFLLQIIL